MTQSLLTRFQQQWPIGKKKRYQSLVNRYSAELYQYAFWLTLNQQDAQDMVQETYVRCWHQIGSFQNPCAKKQKHSLFALLRHQSFYHFETRCSATSTPEFALGCNPQDANLMGIQSSVTQLPLVYREPLVLQSMQKFSTKEISVLLNMSKSSVNNRILEAKQRLITQGEKGHEHRETQCF